MTIIRYALYIVGALIIVGFFGLIASTVIAYIQPRLRRVSRGELNPQTVAECCPPGLGCNDPIKDARKCLRVEARRIGTVAELRRLESTWSAFCGVPRRNGRERAKAQAVYAEARDAIIQRALNDAAGAINAARVAQLPKHLPIHNISEGEVLDAITTTHRFDEIAENGTASVDPKWLS